MAETVLSRYLQTLVDTVVEDYGIDAGRFYADAGVGPIDLSAPGARVSVADADLLWAAAERLADDRLGLRFGARVRYGTFATLGHMLVTSATVGQSVRLACEYALYVGSGGRFDYAEGGGVAQVAYVPFRPGWPAAQLRAEAVLLPFARFARWAANGVEPAAVWLMRQEAEDASAFREAFGAPVHFGDDRNAIAWRLDEMARPMADANAPLHDMLRQHVTAEMPPSGDGDTSAEVADVIRAKLAAPEGLVGAGALADDCAATLGRSLRSLQRDLAAEGTSFRALLADVRFESAKRLLTATDASITDIADHLGYSEPAAFVRAFSVWAGTTPARFRRSSR